MQYKYHRTLFYYFIFVRQTTMAKVNINNYVIVLFQMTECPLLAI